jgi:SAM-dependent methyltransferase
MPPPDPDPPSPDHSVATAAFWDAQVGATSSMYWGEYPLVRSYINTLVTDSWWAYPTHGFKAAWAYKPLAAGLSIGCGTGLLERDLRWLRICEEVDAYDISPEAIRAAQVRAEAERIDRVNYVVADCENVTYPANRYDAVFFHGSMHHMSDPAALLDRLMPALKDDGLIFLDDYVGPTRDEWGDGHLIEANRAYARLPESWRTLPVLSAPYDASDPSEMLRSSSILPAIRERFDILWERPYWGNLLYPVLAQVSSREASLPESEHLLRGLIEQERQLVRDAVFTDPLFVWIVGRVKRPRPHSSA